MSWLEIRRENNSDITNKENDAERVYTKRERSHSGVELPQYSAARKEEYLAILVIMKVAIEHQPRSDVVFKETVHSNVKLSKLTFISENNFCTSTDRKRGGCAIQVKERLPLLQDVHSSAVIVRKRQCSYKHGCIRVISSTNFTKHPRCALKKRRCRIVNYCTPDFNECVHEAACSALFRVQLVHR